jgi:hypothetical protein
MTGQFFRLFLAPKAECEDHHGLVSLVENLNAKQRFGYFDDDDLSHKDDQYERILALLEGLEEPVRSKLVVRARILRVEYVSGPTGRRERVVFDS